MSELTKDQFNDDVKNHVMAVIMDDGAYRHLRFKAPADGNQWFEIVTWPGSLVINGDMGSYTFSRQKDMFQYFRSLGSIYPSEIALVSVDTSTGCEEIDREATVQALLKSYADYHDDDNDTYEALDISLIDKYEVEWLFLHSFFELADEAGLVDAGESIICKYTHHFHWCIHAIHWAIAQYEKWKLEVKNG